MGKWDYGVTIRMLLMKSRYLDMMYKLNQELEIRIEELENKLDNKKIAIVLDSSYVLSGVVEFLDEWSINGWQKKNKTTIINRAEWVEVHLFSA
jgi:ribonuclease HI